MDRFEARMRDRYLRGVEICDYVERLVREGAEPMTAGVRGGKYLREHFREVRARLEISESWHRASVRLPREIREVVECGSGS